MADSFWNRGLHRYIENRLPKNRFSLINQVTPRAELPPITDFDPATYSEEKLRSHNPVTSLNFRPAVGNELIAGSAENIKYEKDKADFIIKLQTWQKSRELRRNETRDIMNAGDMARLLVTIPGIVAAFGTGNAPLGIALTASLAPEIQRVENFRRARAKESAESKKNFPLPAGADLVATIYNLTKSIHGTIVSTAANLDKYAKSGFFGGLNNVLNGINSGINKIDEALYGPKNFRPESAPAK